MDSGTPADFPTQLPHDTVDPITRLIDTRKRIARPLSRNHGPSSRVSWLDGCAAEQLCVHRDNDRAQRHQDRAHRRREEDTLSHEHSRRERNGDDIVARRPPQVLDHLAVGGATQAERYEGHREDHSAPIRCHPLRRRRRCPRQSPLPRRQTRVPGRRSRRHRPCRPAPRRAGAPGSSRPFPGEDFGKHGVDAELGGHRLGDRAGHRRSA